MCENYGKLCDTGLKRSFCGPNVLKTIIFLIKINDLLSKNGILWISMETLKKIAFEYAIILSKWGFMKYDSKNHSRNRKYVRSTNCW